MVRRAEIETQAAQFGLRLERLKEPRQKPAAARALGALCARWPIRSSAFLRLGRRGALPAIRQGVVVAMPYCRIPSACVGGFEQSVPGREPSALALSRPFGGGRPR